MVVPLIIFCYFLSTFGLEKFLQFEPQEIVHDRRSSYQFNLQSIDYDAYQFSQVLIKFFLDYADLTNLLTFYCHVKTLETNYKITSAYFCKKESMTAEADCHEIYEKTDYTSFGNFLDFSINFDPIKGIIIMLLVNVTRTPFRQRPFSGFYYCKLDNILGSISSNYIEIQDYEFYKIRFINSFNNSVDPLKSTHIDHFTSDSFPIYIHINDPPINNEIKVPKWINYNLFTPRLIWRFCLDTDYYHYCGFSFTRTKYQQSVSLEDYFHHYQFPNGTVLLMGKKRNDFLKSGLKCYIFHFMSLYQLAFYSVKNNSEWELINYYTLGKYRKKIKFLTQKNVNVTIREGIYDNKTKYKLYVLYVGNPDPTKIDYEWKKDNIELSSIFIVTSHELVFPNEINESYSGIYELTVYQREPPDNATFIYNVTVVCPPKLTDDTKRRPLFYLIDDIPAHISVSFARDITNLSLEINTIPIDILSMKNKEKDLKRLYLNYQFLTGLDISANISVNQGLIEYEMRNLTKNINMSEDKSHIVTFIAENSIGVSKVSYLIIILERPLFIHNLKDFSCTNNCRNDMKHIFKCTINDTEYLKKGFNTQYTWSLNGLSINTVKGHDQMVYLDINRDTLTLKPFKSDNPTRDHRMTNLFSNSVLSCKVIIFGPFNLLEIVYNTDDRPEFKSLLEAKIQLKDHHINTSSTYWVFPIILLLIVTVVVLGSTLYFCLNFSGKTYNVDQHEISCDQDVEIQYIDNEIYQPHEQDLETNAVQQNYLSFNTYDNFSIESDRNELNAYDLNPGKFNEEGSYVCQYAVDISRFKIINL